MSECKYFLSHEIANAKAHIVACKQKIQDYNDDLKDHITALDELLYQAGELEAAFFKKCRIKEEHRHMVAVNKWLQSRPEVGSLNGGEVGTTYLTPTRFYQMVDGESQTVEVFSMKPLMTVPYGKE